MGHSTYDGYIGVTVITQVSYAIQGTLNILINPAEIISVIGDTGNIIEDQTRIAPLQNYSMKARYRRII